MKRILVIASIVAILLFTAQSLYADGSVGVTYSQIIDDRSAGIAGDYTTKISDRVNFEADVQVQIGDIYNAKLNTNFVFDISLVDLKLLIENKYKGYDLDTLGRSQSVGLAFTLPVDNMNFDIGIGGVNSSPFGTPNAFDTLVGNGFAESKIEGKGLDTVTPELKGIPFKNGNALNVFVSTGFTKGVFDIDVKGAIELLGEGDKQQQVNTTIKTSGRVYGSVFTTALEVGLVSYQDAIHYETAVVTTLGFDF